MFRTVFLILVAILPILLYGIGYHFFKSFINQFNAPHDYLSILILLVISPLCEEVIFRGLIQDLCLQYLKQTWLGLTLVNVLFVALHYHVNHNLVYLVLVFASGMVFSWSKLLYKNLSIPICLHIYYNLVFILALVVLIKK